MPFNTKVSGTWRTGVAPYVKVAGTWRIAKSALRKINGAWKSWFLQGGVLDNYFGVQSVPSFNNNLGSGFEATSLLSAIAVQSDNKIVVGGDFTTPSNRIARLNSDGTRDTAFTTAIGAGFNSTVRALAVQSDGKIVVGGFFISHNNITSNRIARLNSDGTRDTAFTTNIGTGFNGAVQSIAVQSDGKILVGGEFLTHNAITSNRIARLNSDGTRDTAFTTNIGTGFNDTVWSIKVQSDGKIIIAGWFTTFNGATARGIVRLNSDGTLDTSFSTSTISGDTLSIRTTSIQSDGKIFVGGTFSVFNGVDYTISRALRLNSDGSFDTSFSPIFDDEPLSSFIQSDGKIVVGGFFTTHQGVSSNQIARLNTDGTRDTAFTTAIGTGANLPVLAIAPHLENKILVGGEFTTFNEAPALGFLGLNLNGSPISILNGTNNQVYATASQSDGKIVLGGSFTTFDGVTANRIARLNFDGALDTAFTTAIGNGFNSQVRAIAFQAVDSDQKIVVGGSFSLFDVITSNCIARLDSNGNLDTAFLTNIGSGFNSQVEKLAVQSDQKIVVGGFFTTHNGVTSNRIARLNSDGTRDTTFTTNIGTGFNNFVQPLAIQADQKIVVGGFFTTFNGVTVNRIARLNADGTLDTTFDTNTGTGFSDTVNSLTVQPDGKIVVAGQFSTFNGVTVNRIVRLNADGTLDTTFDTNTGTGTSGIIYSIVLQSDEKIVLGGFFTNFNGTTVARVTRLNANGILDTAFNTNTGSGASGAVNAISIQPDGKIVVGGDFATFNGVSRSRIARIGGDIAS
jgi:uncharacterized delta-60 repeat protein